jgi:hypothetical protein
MSAQKAPPKARYVIVPPLTSKTKDGELYKRRADVEDSIAQQAVTTVLSAIYAYSGRCGPGFRCDVGRIFCFTVIVAYMA